MKKKLLLPLAALLSSCATMNDSLTLGASMGAATGAAATYSAHVATGQEPSFQSVMLGAGVGTAVGLLTSYLVHQKVDEDRQLYQDDQTEMHFGDLPPSPFIVPKTLPKKGGR
jgi:hypothetical protein